MGHRVQLLSTSSGGCSDEGRYNYYDGGIFLESYSDSDCDYEDLITVSVPSQPIT